ncbi:MAG: esterase family protein [Alloprevotella sp.]|nr:esterase family protein [Alloprevotella sp.]
MKKLIILLCVLSASISMQAGRVVRDSLSSRILGVTKYYSVYLPDAYLHEPSRKFPVLYLLHGLTDDDRAWSQKGQMERVCDELMASGEARPMVVIMPGAGGEDTKNIWNGYFNMPGWNYEDFFFQELMPTAEAKYRYDGQHRAVAGLSMGGGGSVGYALRHTETFSSCYAMSAWLRADESLQSRNRPGQEKFAALVEAVIAYDPIAYLGDATPERLEAIRNVKWFIDCGDDDYLLSQSLDFYAALRSHKVAAQLRVRDGWHSWEYWHNALRLCLPFVSRNF